MFYVCVSLSLPKPISNSLIRQFLSVFNADDDNATDKHCLSQVSIWNRLFIDVSFAFSFFFCCRTTGRTWALGIRCGLCIIKIDSLPLSVFAVCAWQKTPNGPNDNLFKFQYKRSTQTHFLSDFTHKNIEHKWQMNAKLVTKPNPNFKFGIGTKWSETTDDEGESKANVFHFFRFVVSFCHMRCWVSVLFGNLHRETKVHL